VSVDVAAAKLLRGRAAVAMAPRRNVRRVGFNPDPSQRL
jgi:hypothetical protein